MEFRLRGLAFAAGAALMLGCIATLANAQQPGSAPADAPSTQPPTTPVTNAPDQTTSPFTLRTESNIVLVPTTVATRKNEMIYALKPEQFRLTMDGVPQTLKIDEDTDTIGLSLVVVIQCSRAGEMEIGVEQGLGTMIDAIIGGAPREVAVVNYSDVPELYGRFSSSPDDTRRALSKLTPCEEPQAVTYDAVAYAANMLAKRNDHNRHAILLISETRDHGSKTRASEVVALLGRTNTVLDAVSFRPGVDEIKGSLFHGQFGPGLMGLLISAVQGMRSNAAKTMALLSGGEYLTFDSQKGFDRNLLGLSNRIHNYYLLSFQPPVDAAPGLHKIDVTVPDYSDAKIRARESFWIGPPPAAPVKGDEPVPDTPKQ
jgi:VWFA-related protein